MACCSALPVRVMPRPSTWVVESPPGHACFCHQAESTRGFRQRWRAAGQSAEAPAGQWETQQTGVEKGRGEDCPARQRPGAEAGWRVRWGGGAENRDAGCVKDQSTCIGFWCTLLVG